MSADTVVHGDGLGFPPAFLKRWTCYGYRFEAEGKVVAISGDTIPCEGIDRLARNADVLVHCCYMASAEIENEHFRRVMQHTLAGGDSSERSLRAQMQRRSRSRITVREKTTACWIGSQRRSPATSPAASSSART